MANQPRAIQALAATSVQKIQPPNYCENPKKQLQSSPKLDITTREIKLMTILNSELKPAFSIYCVDYAARFGEHSNDVMREFARQLIKHQIGARGLQCGIQRLAERAATNKFTPNPAEFALMCKPTAADLGIPEQDTAIKEVREARTRWRYKATPYPYSHDICRYLNQRVGYEFYHLTEREWLARCTKEYNRLLTSALEGKLPAYDRALPQQEEPEKPAYEQLGYPTLTGKQAKDLIAAKLKRRAQTKPELTEVGNGRVDTSRLGPRIAGSSEAHCTTASQMTGNKPE